MLSCFKKILKKEKESMKDIKNSEIEKCVLCGADTQYTKNININERENYIEGAGQICKECAKKKD